MKPAGALLVAAWLAASSAQARVNVSPMLIEETLSKENNEIAFTIANGGDTPLEIELSTSPLQHDRSGSAIQGRGDYRYDVSKRIQLPAQRITIKPRKWRRVRATVDVPDRPGGGYAFIHVKTIPDPRSSAMVLATVDFRIIVELTFGRATHKARVEDVISDGSGLRVAVHNEGDGHFRPTGTVELRDPGGRVVFTSSLASENVFPALTRELALARAPPTLQPGQYTAVVRLSSPTPANFERKVAVVDGRLVVQREGTP